MTLATRVLRAARGMRFSHSMHHSSLFNVEGKVAVVTGGSRGIGYMIAEAFARNGVRTIITARKVAAADEAAAALSKLGAPCTSIPADVSSEEGIAAFIKAVGELESSVDSMQNSTGF